MKRISFRIPEEQLKRIDELVRKGEFPNRSEVLRAAVREFLRR